MMNRNYGRVRASCHRVIETQLPWRSSERRTLLLPAMQLLACGVESTMDNGSSALRQGLRGAQWGPLTRGHWCPRYLSTYFEMLWIASPATVTNRSRNTTRLYFKAVSPSRSAFCMRDSQVNKNRTLIENRDGETGFFVYHHIPNRKCHPQQSPLRQSRRADPTSG